MKIFSLILFITLILSCNRQDSFKLTSAFDVNQIDQVKIQNNSGTFYLSSEQLNLFRKDMEKLTFEDGYTPQVGTLQLTLKIKGKDYKMITSSDGQFIELPVSMIGSDKFLKEEKEFVYFKTNGVNFDKYKNEQLRWLKGIKSFSPNWLTGIWSNLYESNTTRFRTLAFSNDTIYSPNEDNVQICLNDFYSKYRSKTTSTDTTYMIAFTNDFEQISYEFKRSKESFSSDTILTLAIVKNGKTYREHSTSSNLTFKKPRYQHITALTSN
jgi:hypothetical protein